MNNKPEIKHVITRCGVDSILPLALIYALYIVLHGHLSPGGGFQGGVLIAAVIALIAMAYGYETASRAISFDLVHEGEGLASVVYVALALMGVAVGAQFCQNILYTHGAIGDLYSSGTIFWMNVTVGVKVFTGISSVSLLMLSVLQGLEEKKEG